MTKLQSFVRLDFVTVKPYFTGKNLLVYAAVAVFLTTTSGNIASGLGVGAMLGTMFASYPFAVGEKCNMDALYATLSVDRKTVVLGRYVFAMLFNVLAILCSVILASAGLLISQTTRSADSAGDTLLAIVLIAALFAVIQAIQLPIYFRYGYSKAKFFSMMPFAAIMVSYTMFTIIGKDSGLSGKVNEIFSGLNGGGLIALIVFIVFLALLVSYSLSLSFYQKREF